jgi:RNA polymerase sigma-70 factor (ECF subfamily)
MTDAEFEVFHAETAGPLHAYLARVGGVNALADDLVQSAYVRFLAARRVPDDPRACRVYLFRVARNLLRDEFRKRARETVPRPLAPEASHLDCESRIEVRRAFEVLSGRDRELLWLAHVADLSHREISEVAEVGEASVRVLLHRARGRFREQLGARGVGPEDLA